MLHEAHSPRDDDVSVAAAFTQHVEDPIANRYGADGRITRREPFAMGMKSGVMP
jgi:hypothetical protein